MKRFYFLFCLGMMVITVTSFAANTPQTISMDGATDNATAFGADGTLGIDNTCTFYVHWDASYLYVGWSAGRTNYSSDMFYVGIDLVDGLGSNGAIEGVDFNSSTPDFYAVFENNSSFYGAPVSNGNAFEIYQDDGANGWSFVSRTDGNDNVESKIIFSDGPGEVRFRIAWTTLGVTPGASQPLGLTFWNNNPFGNYGWASWPADNPAGSSTPQTMTHKLLYTSTADGTNPSTAGTSVPLATTLPVELFDFSGAFQSNGVALTWTAAEELFSHYEVERLSEDGAFKKIDRVAAEGEFGQPTSYQYLDYTAPLGQTLTYRLAMVDMDGSVDYSNQIEVNSAEGAISISPNPTYGQLTVALPGTPRNPGTIRVLNMQGQTVYSQSLAEGQSVWNLDLSDLASGAYQAVIQWDNQRTVKRFSLY